MKFDWEIYSNDVNIKCPLNFTLFWKNLLFMILEFYWKLIIFEMKTLKNPRKVFKNVQWIIDYKNSSKPFGCIEFFWILNPLNRYSNKLRPLSDVKEDNWLHNDWFSTRNDNFKNYWSCDASALFLHIIRGRILSIKI